MRRTSLVDLLVPLVVFGLTTYVLLRFSYGSLPPLSYYPPIPLVVLAIAEAITARRVRGAVRHDPDARPMAAIVIARCVALGKASALVGAGVAGVALGVIGRVAPEASRVDAASHDLRVGIFLFFASVLLVASGLLLERAGIDPDRRDKDRQTPEVRA